MLLIPFPSVDDVTQKFAKESLKKEESNDLTIGTGFIFSLVRSLSTLIKAPGIHAFVFLPSYLYNRNVKKVWVPKDIQRRRNDREKIEFDPPDLINAELEQTVQPFREHPVRFHSSTRILFSDIAEQWDPVGIYRNWKNGTSLASRWLALLRPVLRLLIRTT